MTSSSSTALGSVGTAHIGAVSGITGNFAVALMGEYTLANHFFAGLGGGYGVLNNPNGPLFQARVGWYPFVHVYRERARRHGLMIGLDAREYFVGSDVGTVSQISLSIGYERF